MDQSLFSKRRTLLLKIRVLRKEERMKIRVLTPYGGAGGNEAEELQRHRTCT